MSAGIISEVDRHSGNLYGTLVRVSGASPVVTLQIPFAAAYGVLGLISNDLTTFEIWLANFSAYERQTTGTKWALSTSAKGVAMITGWSTDQDGLLLADVQVALLSADGDAHPLTQGTGTLPTLAGQPALHTLGAVSINGSAVAGVRSAGVELGQELQVYRGDGQRYPTNCGRVGGQPRMTFTHNDPQAVLTSLGLLGVDISANLVQYFRLYSATTGTVAVSGGTGISVTAASGRIGWGDLSSGMQELPSIGVFADCLSTSSTHPLAISTGATLP